MQTARELETDDGPERFRAARKNSRSFRNQYLIAFDLLHFSDE